MSADEFVISVEATDNDTLSFSGTSNDTSEGGIAQFPGFTLVLSDIDWIGMVGIIDDVIDNSTQIDVSSFSTDMITFTMAAFGPTVAPGETLVVDFGTFDIVAHHDVPVPTTLLLLGIGLAGLGFARRRKVH